MRNIAGQIMFQLRNGSVVIKGDEFKNVIFDTEILCDGDQIVIFYAGQPFNFQAIAEVGADFCTHNCKRESDALRICGIGKNTVQALLLFRR